MQLLRVWAGAGDRLFVRTDLPLFGRQLIFDLVHFALGNSLRKSTMFDMSEGFVNFWRSSETWIAVTGIDRDATFCFVSASFTLGCVEGAATNEQTSHAVYLRVTCAATKSDVASASVSCASALHGGYLHMPDRCRSCSPCTIGRIQTSSPHQTELSPVWHHAE